MFSWQIMVNPLQNGGFSEFGHAWCKVNPSETRGNLGRADHLQDVLMVIVYRYRNEMELYGIIWSLGIIYIYRSIYIAVYIYIDIWSIDYRYHMVYSPYAPCIVYIYLHFTGP